MTNIATPVTRPASTPLEALSIALNSFLDREGAVVAFALLPAKVQFEVKEESWLLVGKDIDPANPQPHDRGIADYWSGCVIRNEVQVPGEEGPRADIQRNADIAALKSLFRRALDIVIAADASSTI